MLRHPVLAERMTDEKVEKIVNLVSKGTDIEVRQEAALFVNAQVFQDPGIVAPEPRRRKRRQAARGGDDADDPDFGENEDGEMADREVADSVVTLLNSET